MGVHVANFMDHQGHGPVKPQQGLIPIPQALVPIPYAGMDRPYALYAGCITALVGSIPSPVAGGLHLVCIQRAIWLRSIFANA